MQRRLHHFLERVRTPTSQVTSVGFAINNKLMLVLIELLVGVNERLITSGLQTGENFYATVDENSIHQILLRPIDNTMSRILSLDEVRSSIFSMKNNKPSSIDNISAEIFEMVNSAVGFLRLDTKILVYKTIVLPTLCLGNVNYVPTPH